MNAIVFSTIAIGDWLSTGFIKPYLKNSLRCIIDLKVKIQDCENFLRNTSATNF
jgi:hypothetical protein